MSLTYIAGFDGSSAAAAAVRMARRLGETTGADVVAATVSIPTPFVPGKGASGGADAELDEAVHEAAEHILAKLQEPQSVLRRVIPGRSAAQGLYELAEHEEAALIAVGVTHHGAAGRILIGSVGHRLLHGSPCPVVVVPADASDEIRTIGVAFDGGPQARLALAAGAGLARRLGARLVLITAVRPTVYGVAGAPTLVLEAEHVAMDQAKEMCGEAIDDLPDGINAEARVVAGPAGRVIAEAAGDDVDLLVTGSRAYGGVRSVLLGSTSGYLADHAACPVLVVPRGSGATVDGTTTAAAAAEA